MNWEEKELRAKLRVAQCILEDGSPSIELTEWYTASAFSDIEAPSHWHTVEELTGDLAEYQTTVRDMLTTKNGFLAHRMVQAVFNIIYTEAALQALEERGDDT